MVIIFIIVLIMPHGSVSVTDVSNWDLVFIGHSGNGKSIMATWDRKVNGKCTLHQGCIPLGSHPYLYENKQLHFKSPFVDAWEHIDVQEILVEFYVKGRRNAFLVFDGRGSTSKNWFTPERLRQSSFGDLFSDGCFDIFGLQGKNRQRFLILQDSGSCVKDRGWVAVLDGLSGRCKWHHGYSYPQFMYARNHHKAFFDKSDFAYADCMTVYLKLKNHKASPEPGSNPEPKP